MKDGKIWDDWRTITIDAADAQDIADVLNPDYSTKSPEDTALFHENQKFMHSVFDKFLHANRGKSTFEIMTMTSTLKNSTRN